MSSMNGPVSPSSGMSLIELMISLVVASIVITGLIQMFTATREGSRLLTGKATVAESARFALQLMARSIQKAGYRGCNSKTVPGDNVSDVPYEFNLTAGIQGFNAEGTTWSPEIASMLPVSNRGDDANVYLASGTGIKTSAYDDCAVNGCLKNGADILTLRFADSKEYRVDTENFPVTTGAEQVVIDGVLTDVEKDFDRYHLVFINDCTSRDVFVVTDMAPEGAGQTRISHNVGGHGSTRNLQALLGKGRGYTSGTTVMGIGSHTYFIGASVNRNSQGDRVDALFRKSGLDAPRELVEGVEDLQIMYGVDTAGTALAPDIFMDASQVTDFNDVIVVRVEITVNSVDDVGSAEVDGILRRKFSQTVHLRNRLVKE